MKLVIDQNTNERVFEMNCECGKQGGEIRFPADHGRESDDALEQEMRETYAHTCHDCCCIGRFDAVHPNYGNACKAKIHA